MTDTPDTIAVLRWQGPIEMAEGLAGEQGARFPAAAGVYLWTIPIGSDYLVHYIGAAADVRSRQLRHVHGVLSGEYFLPKLDGGGFVGWAMDEEYKDLPSDEGLFRRTARFVAEERWVQEAREYLTRLRILVAETERAFAVERAIQERFQAFQTSQPDAGVTRFCPPISLRGSRKAEPVRILKHEASAAIPGITDWIPT